jgi:hypothetical protein
MRGMSGAAGCSGPPSAAAAHVDEAKYGSWLWKFQRGEPGGAVPDVLPARSNSYLQEQLCCQAAIACQKVADH